MSKSDKRQQNFEYRMRAALEQEKIRCGVFARNLKDQYDRADPGSYFKHSEVRDILEFGSPDEVYALLFGTFSPTERVRRDPYHRHQENKYEEGDKEERHQIPPLVRFDEAINRYSQKLVLGVLRDILEDMGDLENIMDILEPTLEMRR